MTYVPDKLGERRRKDGVSQTAAEFFVKYCEHADKETGLTFANVKTCAEAFSMRIDNAQKYDRELIDKDWIRLIEKDGRIYRKIEAGWLPASQRNGQGKAENTEKDVFLNFRKTLDDLLNFSESSYILGENPKFKENLLNFRNAYKEVLNQHTDQPIDQHTDQLKTDAASANESPAKPRAKAERESLTKLPEDFSITPEMRSWADAKVPNVSIDDELEEFVNFWRYIATKNHRRTTRGWVATWQKRMTELQKKSPAALARQNGVINGVSQNNSYRNSGGKPAATAYRRSDAETLASLGLG